jgi:hypothetical protein
LLKEQPFEANNMFVNLSQGTKVKFVLHVWMNMQSMWW